MAGKAVVEIVMLDQKAQNTLGGLNEKLTFLRNKLEDVKIGSKAFEDLQTQIQKTSSEVKTLEKQMEGLEPQQQAEAFLKLGEAIMGGFVASTGALAMFGVENERIAEIQTRVQGAIAVAMGVRMMAEGVLYAATAKRVFIEKAAIIQTKLMTVVTKANTLATTAAVAVQKLFGKSILGTAKSLKVLKTAILSTGVLALAVGIGTVVSKIGGWLTGSKRQEEAQKRLAAATERLNKKLDEELDMMREKADFQRRLKNAESERAKGLIELQEKERLQIENTNELKEAYKKQEEGVRELQQALAIIPPAKLEEILASEGLRDIKEEMIDQSFRQEEAIRDEIDAYTDNTEAIENFQKRYKALLDQMRKDQISTKELEDEITLLRIEDEGKRALKELEIKEKKDIAALKGTINFEEQKRLINKKYNLLEKDLREKIAEDKRKKDEEDRKKEADDLEAKRGEDIMSLEDLLVKKAQMEQAYFDSKLTEEQRLLNAVEDKYFTELELAKQNGLDTVDLEKAKQAEIDKIKDEAREEEEAKNQESLDKLLQARVAFIGAVGNTIGQLSGLFDEGSKAAKTAALAEIAINTGLGFIQGLDIAQKSAKATGPAAALSFPIFYASQIAAVLGAVKQAKAALGGGGPAASAPPVASVSAPTRSGNFTLSTPQANRSSSAMIKTFVVADEMSQEQAQLADIRRRSTI